MICAIIAELSQDSEDMKVSKKKVLDNQKTIW